MIYLSEKIYRYFEKGIVPLIRALHEVDIPTCYESCQGHLKPVEEDPFPSVYIDASSTVFAEEKFQELLKIIFIWNQRREDKWKWVLVEQILDTEIPRRLFWLRPAQGNAARSTIVLSRLRKEALDLADFIIRVRNEPILMTVEVPIPRAPFLIIQAGWDFGQTCGGMAASKKKSAAFYLKKAPLTYFFSGVLNVD